MSDDRASVLHPLAIGYAIEIYDELLADIAKDGFNHLPDVVTLIGLTHTECLKIMSIRVAELDPELAAFLLETSAGELSRIAKVLRDAKS